MYRKSLKWLSLALGLIALGQVDAATVENSHREPVQVNISVRESNRIAVDGRRISRAKPAQPDAITWEKDEEHGALYVTMRADRQVLGTVTLFITDDQNTTYKLVLVPQAIGGQDLVLQPPQEKQPTAKHTTAADGRATSFQRRIKDLILVMVEADGPNDSDAEKVPVNKEIPLWQEGRLVLKTKYLSGDLVGEQYRLTNISARDMLLVEQELFRRGVRAVSIKSHTLPPGDGTDIYIVRERKSNE
jgi:conjugal transfer pilus assembly protein TraK